jgi:hypothetical protein
MQKLLLKDTCLLHTVNDMKKQETNEEANYILNELIPSRNNNLPTI